MPDALFADPRLAVLYDALDDDRSDLDAYLELLEEMSAKSVVDIGCGTGTFACLVASRGLDVIGVDPAAASLEVAQAKESAELVQWIHGDATALEPGEADAATMTGNVAQVFVEDDDWLSTRHVTANEAGWRPGADPKRVKADVATANTLRQHQPTLAAALAKGEVAVDRVREVCRSLNERNRHVLEGAQDALIDLCRSQSTFRQFTRDVEQLARLADTDGTEPPKPRNHGKVHLDDDRVTATFDLHRADAMAFAKRVEAEADRLFRQHTDDAKLCLDLLTPPRSELLAQAFLNLVERGAGNRNRGRLGPIADISIIVDVDQTTVGDLFADGILLPGKGVGPVDWSKKALDLTGATLRYASHEWELLTCDAEYTWIIKDAGGHPVACKPGERHASRQQRRNLEFRDGRCCFPGCDTTPNWCDAHHVHHHRNGGPTETPNLALLCRRHHGVIHRRGWSMKANTAPGDGEGFFTITTPSGTVLHTQHQRPPAPV